MQPQRCTSADRCKCSHSPAHRLKTSCNKNGSAKNERTIEIHRLMFCHEEQQTPRMRNQKGRFKTTIGDNPATRVNLKGS